MSTESHSVELGQAVEFVVDVGVEQRVVALASAPEDKVERSEFLGHIETFLNLGRCVGHYVGIRVGGCSVGVPVIRSIHQSFTLDRQPIRQHSIQCSAGSKL